MLKKPNLFIVGAAKSGTTTLYAYLQQHSKVFMPKNELNKEPAFFSTKGAWIGLERYLNIFHDASSNHQYIGEASTAYLTDTSSAKRIYDFNPDSRIIIILRNPVDRAYSLYNWMVQEGYEFSSNFQSALAKESIRKKKKIPNFLESEYYWNYMYFSSGLYFEQVKRYKELFDDKQILVIKFEDMVADLSSTYQLVSDFLNIDYEEINIMQENESQKVYSPLLSFIARKVNDQVLRLEKLGMTLATKQLRDKLIYLLQKKEKPNKLTGEVKDRMINLYISDIEKLESLINKDLSDWKQR